MTLFQRTIYWEKNGLISENPEISHIGQNFVTLYCSNPAIPQPHQVFLRFALMLRLCTLPWTRFLAPSLHLSKSSSNVFSSTKLSFLYLLRESGTYPYWAFISVCFTLWLLFTWYNFPLQDSPPSRLYIQRVKSLLYSSLCISNLTPLSKAQYTLIDIWIDLRDLFGCNCGFLKTDCNCPGLEYWKNKETLSALRRAFVRLILLATLGGISSLLANDQSLPPEHPSHLTNFHSPQGPRQKDKRGRK